MPRDESELYSCQCKAMAILRSRKALFDAVLILLVIFTVSHLYTSKHDFTSLARTALQDHQIQFCSRLSQLFTKHEPRCAPLELSESAGWPRYDASFETLRENHIDHGDEIMVPMQVAHDGFVREMRQSGLTAPYVLSTRGVVSAAGGKYLPTFLVTLRLLRRTGCTLPVELFVKDMAEYEPRVCETLLPELGARCVVLSDVMGLANTNSSSIEHYQLKSFAVLFSSFEDVVWLDADCIPVYDPETLLLSDPYVSTGLVTWPDYWASTISPLYFNISRQAGFSSTERATTEAGVFLVSKKTHAHTLALAAYYNYYGPSHYYHLLAQGAPGEGDKDTFVQAATAVNQTFYAVSERVADLGHRRFEDSDWDIIHVAMMQADPIQDFELIRQGKWRVVDESVADAPRAFFIHANMVKLSAGNDLLHASKNDEDDGRRRLWTAPDASMRRLGYDVEKRAWEEVLSVSCALGDVFGTEFCDQVQMHWKTVFERSNFTAIQRQP